jgi:hypothetical protein
LQVQINTDHTIESDEMIESAAGRMRFRSEKTNGSNKKISKPGAGECEVGRAPRRAVQSAHLAVASKLHHEAD